MGVLQKQEFSVPLTHEDLAALRQVYEYLLNKPLPMIEIEGGVVFLRNLISRIETFKQIKS